MQPASTSPALRRSQRLSCVLNRTGSSLLAPDLSLSMDLFVPQRPQWHADWEPHRGLGVAGVSFWDVRCKNVPTKPSVREVITATGWSFSGDEWIRPVNHVYLAVLSGRRALR